MTRITFVSASGENKFETEAPAGISLLDAAQQNGQPLEGTCEGQMACSTCHVIIAPDDFDKLPEATEMEEDLLDLAAHVKRTSRLACQIILTEDIESLTVHMPAASNNMQGR